MKSGRVGTGSWFLNWAAGRANPPSPWRSLGPSPPPFPSVKTPAVSSFCTPRKPARNVNADDYTWNYADTADLLGWYEVTYEDGFVDNVPLRYGVNILEAGWGRGHTRATLRTKPSSSIAATRAKGPLTLFAYEWINPRRGIRVKEVRLKASARFRNVDGRVSPDNPLLLAAVSVVKKRTPPEPKPLSIATK